MRHTEPSFACGSRSSVVADVGHGREGNEMNLTILYLLGPTGDKILQTFNNNDSEVKHKIINIEDQDYYQISIEDNNSYIHKVCKA